MVATVFIVIAVLLRILSNPFGNVFQKKLTAKGNHPLVVNFLSYFILSILCLPIAAGIKWQELPAPFLAYSILGGIAGALGNSFLVKALQHGELSVLGPINAYKAVVGMITGILLLSEIPSVKGLLGIALIIWGSYFVLDTTEDRFTWALFKRKDIQYRILAMILTAIEAVLIKKVIRYSSPTIAFFSWCWFGAIFSFLLLLVYRISISQIRQQAQPANLVKYLLLVICIGTMQLTTNYALNHLPVGYALSLFQLSTIVSVILGHRIFQEQGLLKKLLGSVIMIIGSIVVILAKG